MAPNICCGDFAVESSSVRSGYCDLRKRTQPGQQEVNIGQLFKEPFWKRSRNSLSELYSLFRILTATLWPVRISTARETSDMPP